MSPCGFRGSFMGLTRSLIVVLLRSRPAPVRNERTPFEFPRLIARGSVRKVVEESLGVFYLSAFARLRPLNWRHSGKGSAVPFRADGDVDNNTRISGALRSLVYDLETFWRSCLEAALLFLPASVAYSCFRTALYTAGSSRAHTATAMSTLATHRAHGEYPPRWIFKRDCNLMPVKSGRGRARCVRACRCRSRAPALSSALCR